MLYITWKVTSTEISIYRWDIINWDGHKREEERAPLVETGLHKLLQLIPDVFSRYDQPKGIMQGVG